MNDQHHPRYTFARSVASYMKTALDKAWDQGLRSREQLIEAFGATNPTVDTGEWVDKYLKAKTREIKKYGEEESDQQTSG